MTRIRLKSLLLVLIIMFVVMMVEAKVNNLRDEVFNRVWRGFMDDDTQSYKSHIFAVKINNSTNIIDIYIVKTSDYEHVIRKYPVYVHLKGDYVMKDNLTDSIDLSVFNVQCENMALPNSLADPTGCQQYSSLWTSGARYWYSLFDVDEDNQVNYYINIRNEEDKTYIMWKGPVNQVNQLASICSMSENWKLDNNDMFGRLSESGYVRFNSDGTYTQQINQAIDFGKARSVCKMQENFLSMKIKGRYQYLAELGILVATRSVCSDLQYWVQDVIDCNLCNKREQAFGLSAIVSFDSGNCASTTLQVENLSDKYAALRISRAFDPPIPKEIEAQPAQPCSNNDMELAVAISVVALVLVCVILGVIAYWMFIYFKNRRRPAYKPLE